MVAAAGDSGRDPGQWTWRHWHQAAPRAASFAVEYGPGRGLSQGGPRTTELVLTEGGQGLWPEPPEGECTQALGPPRRGLPGAQGPALYSGLGDDEVLAGPWPSRKFPGKAQAQRSRWGTRNRQLRRGQRTFLGPGAPNPIPTPGARSWSCRRSLRAGAKPAPRPRPALLRSSPPPPARSDPASRRGGGQGSALPKVPPPSRPGPPLVPLPLPSTPRPGFPSLAQGGGKIFPIQKHQPPASFRAIKGALGGEQERDLCFSRSRPRSPLPP